MDGGTIWYMFWAKSNRLEICCYCIFVLLNQKIILLGIDFTISMRQDQII